MEPPSLHISSLCIDDLDQDDERSSEIATVSYIFPELTLLASLLYLSIAVSPAFPVLVVFSDEPVVARTISHFPPLQLTLESTWVTKETLARLHKELVGQWEEIRDQVLYAVIDHLVQKAEVAFTYGRGTESLVVSKDLEEQLIAFNKKSLKDEFNKGTYECGSPRRERLVTKLFPCNHVFCIICLTDYYTTSITEGDVSNVKCMEPSCILNKKPKQEPDRYPTPQTEIAEPAEAQTPHPLPKAILPPTLPPEELEDLGLSSELVTRYRVLKRKAALDADPATIYCPRSWCQAPSRSSLEEMDKNIGTRDLYLTERHLELKMAELNGQNVDGKDEAPADPQPMHHIERLDVCSSCAYSFCKVCLKGWHGDYVICQRKNAPKTEEELATEEYLHSAAAQCPTCGAHVIKAYGCNHMLCRDPYKHFNSKENERCYMKLGVRPPDPDHPEEVEDEEDNFEDFIAPFHEEAW
ncbi:hypothetical protein BGX38DRAFT_1238581 [Terfezia claveryi]|nr:hypothetical protein BGX38DRAFT_1238581 [Terfezia claveryi]